MGEKGGKDCGREGVMDQGERQMRKHTHLQPSMHCY